MRLEGIRVRLVSIILVLVLTPLIFLSLTTFNLVSNQLKQRLVSEQEISVKDQVEILSSLFSEYRGLTLALRDLPPVQGIIRARETGFDEVDGSSYSQWVKRFDQIFISMIRSNRYIYQIRYLDADGQELVNVKQAVTGAISPVLPDQLQNKANEFYFTEGLRMEKDQVYVSPVTLNREFDRIEIPYRPAIRFITPVFDDATGLRAGMIIVNMGIDPIIDLTERSDQEVVITDQDGYFIEHPDSRKEFGAELETGENFFVEQPELVINTKKQDYRNHYDPEEEHFRIWRKFFYDPLDTSRYWVVFYVINESELLLSVQNLRQLIVIVVVIVASICAVIAYAVSSNIARPILKLRSASEEIASGNLSVDIDISAGNDEISDLGKSFVAMQKDLRSLYTGMEEVVSKRTAELETALDSSKKSNTAMLNIMEDLEETRSALEKQRDELEQSEKRFRTSFDRSPIGFALVSLEGKWLKVNAALSKILGYEEEELLAKTFQDITHPDDLDADLSKVNELVRGDIPGYEIEKRYLHKMGYYIWALLSVSLVRDSEGKPLYFVSQIIDVTQRKRVEDAKSDFVSLASHQLRTPLTALKWILEAFKKGKAGSLSDMQKELITDADAATMNMSETITTMLLLSRIEAGQMKVDHNEINLHSLMEEVVDEQRLQQQSKNQTLNIDIAEGIRLVADQSILKEILRNLVSNAIKYTPEGGNISVRMNADAESAHIQIKDSGLGIPPEDQEKIFTKFFRAGNVMNSETDGTGLGLYLVHSLVRILSGNIRFESYINEGTTFYVDIPLTPPAP